CKSSLFRLGRNDLAARAPGFGNSDCQRTVWFRSWRWVRLWLNKTVGRICTRSDSSTPSQPGTDTLSHRHRHCTFAALTGGSVPDLQEASIVDRLHLRLPPD